MKQVTKQVQEGLGDIKIYPCIGNHDTYPQDVINMQVPRENKAINEWGPAWDSMIGDSAQIENWKNWGYFSKPFTKSDGTPIGETPTKVISLNSNIP